MSTRSPARPHARALLPLLVALALLAWPAAARGSQQPARTLAPVGSGYTPETLEAFAAAAAARDTTGNVELLVLPITFGTDALATSPSERRKNLDLADRRRGQLEAACEAIRTPAQACRATLVPILIRDDAFLPANLALFTDDVDGVYILGGDQTVAMQVIADTPAERRLAELYAAGALVGGNSAGAAVESLTMIAGYTGSNGPENGMQQGSVDLWAPDGGVSDRTRGLIFGLPETILDQHVLQRGRAGRLISAAWTTGQLGVGADAETGLLIRDESRLETVFGRSAALVVDTATYGSAGRYAGPTQSLAISRVATHVLPSGGFGYDLDARLPLVGGQPEPAPAIDGRDFAALALPAGAGPLLLGGDLSAGPAGPAGARFVELSGGAGARVVVLTAGYPRANDSRAAAKAHAEALAGLGAAAQWFALDGRYEQQPILDALAAADGVWLTSPDQSRVLAALEAAAPVREALRARWQAGAALLADNAAAAALGGLMSADPPPPATTSGLEEASIIDFRPDGVTLQPGLGLLPGLAVEPRFLPDRHWGRLYNLLAADQALLGLGIDVGTAVEITIDGPVARGQSVALTLDGRAASFALGDNGALAARYVILDSFVDGDPLTP